jgi:tetrahydromethanopterin S-methyltransferase subunit B
METKQPTINDTPRFHVQHALTGAAYGLLMGTAFVLVAAFINQWLYPDIPFGVDWSQASVRWILIGFGLALVGAMTCLFTESFYGLVAGTVTAGLLALSNALYLTSVSGGAKFILLLFTLAPVAVMSLPIALVIRRLTENHARALHMKWLLPRIFVLVLVAVALGAGGGYYMKISRDALMAVQMMHDNLQVAPENQKKEIREVAGVREHAGMGYSIFQRDSMVTTTGYDVWAEYEDGYIVECVVVVYPGSTPYIRSCDQMK